MFRMEYTTPHEGEIEVLALERDPMYYGVGNYKDMKGNLWDVVSAYGNNGEPVVHARMIGDQSYYGTGTNDSCAGHHSWSPFYLQCKNPKSNCTPGIPE